MSKKDFEVIARVLQQVRDFAECPPLGCIEYDGASVAEYASIAFADMLASQNPRFNRDRFLRACVPGANVRARS